MGARVNKSELVDAIAEKRGLPRKRAEAVVEMVFEMMVDSLKQGERIEVRGFGSFVVKHYGAYQGRNPRSGQPIQVKEKRLPFFKVGKELKERVDADKTPIAVDHDDADEDSTPPAPAPAPAAPDPAGGGGPGST